MELYICGLRIVETLHYNLEYYLMYCHSNTRLRFRANRIPQNTAYYTHGDKLRPKRRGKKCCKPPQLFLHKKNSFSNGEHVTDGNCTAGEMLPTMESTMPIIQLVEK